MKWSKTYSISPLKLEIGLHCAFSDGKIEQKKKASQNAPPAPMMG